MAVLLLILFADHIATMRPDRTHEIHAAGPGIYRWSNGNFDAHVELVQGKLVVRYAGTMSVHDRAWPAAEEIVSWLDNA